MNLACDGKIAHPSRKVAQTELRLWVRKLRLRGKRDALGVYRCAACLMWHAGNVDPDRTPAARRPPRPEPTVEDSLGGAA